MTAHGFAPVILREYDIRGQIGKNLSERDAYTLGRAFGTFVRHKGGKTACVGYDGRHTSPAMAKALIRGLNKTGIDVDFIGLGPSPMLYFAVKSSGADAGVMVTGSHNPPDYNGFKMMLQNSGVYGETIQELGRIAAAGDFETGTGKTRALNMEDSYIDRLLQDLSAKRDLKIAWDAGNGAAGNVLKKLVERLPGEHILLYADIDGDFPNHHPDPTVDENLADLRRTVLENKCDLGIAFDGDGDRIGVVDETGAILRCDILMTVYAREVLKKHPGAAIIGDVKCSQVMFDAIEKMGGHPVMWKTGHSLVKAKMAELKAPLAGELSGHIFFADGYYGYDDALYCAVRLMNCLDNGKSLSSLTAHLPRLYGTPEIRVDIEESEKFALVQRVLEDMKSRRSEEFHVNDIDGVRVTTPDGWWLLRASNTQNALVARIEASSEEGLKRLETTFSDALAKLGLSITL